MRSAHPAGNECEVGRPRFALMPILLRRSIRAQETQLPADCTGRSRQRETYTNSFGLLRPQAIDIRHS